MHKYYEFTEAILLFLYTGVKFVASPTGRTLPKVVKGKLFKGEQLGGGLINCAFEKNFTRITKAK